MQKSSTKNAKSTTKKASGFEKFSSAVTRATGSTAAFITASSLIVAWLVSGPVFHYSETWQLIINTGTTIITFLMVFLIQKSQNKDSMAIQLKLNELVAANQHASNRLVSVEDLSAEELEVLQKFYSHLNAFAKREKSFLKGHSIDEAKESADRKLKGGKKKMS